MSISQIRPYFRFISIAIILFLSPAFGQVQNLIKPVDVQRVAALTGTAQTDELQKILANDYLIPDKKVYETVFVQEDKLRPGLRSLIADEKVGKTAIWLLCLIGVPEDIKLIVEHAPPSNNAQWFANRWLYYVACALLKPTTEREWNFLQSCALNEYKDWWIDQAAIRTLMLIASPRSRQTLEKVRVTNKNRANYIEGAIRYIKSASSVLSDENLKTAGEKVALVIMIEGWEGNRKPRFNAKGDMALIDCEFFTREDHYIYTATFHSVAGKWELRGVRQTYQASIIMTEID